MAADKPKSILVGFSVCPLCGGKTHVKRIEAEGKRVYSHCLDEHDKGCSHTHYATNAQQDQMMRAKMRPLASAPTATPSQAPAAEPAPPSLPSPPSGSSEAKPPVRRGLFNLKG